MRNVFANWTGYVVGLIVSFFLTPLLVHHLGPASYGVWTLLVSLTAYLGLLDLGIRSAVTRYVARSESRGEPAVAAEIAAAAIGILGPLAGAALLASIALGWLAPSLFHVAEVSRATTATIGGLVGAARPCPPFFSAFRRRDFRAVTEIVTERTGIERRSRTAVSLVHASRRRSRQRSRSAGTPPRLEPVSFMATDCEHHRARLRVLLAGAGVPARPGAGRRSCWPRPATRAVLDAGEVVCGAVYAGTGEAVFNKTCSTRAPGRSCTRSSARPSTSAPPRRASTSSCNRAARPRVEPSALGMIPRHAFSYPYEGIRLKK
jgi:hypothetical protein